MGTQLPLPKKGRSPPRFSAHVCCGQMAACIKMALGMEVGLGPGHIVLDGDPAPPLQKRHSPSIFGPCLLWANGCMYQDTTWYGGRPQPRRHCVRRGPSAPSRKRHSPQFLANVRCGQTVGWTKMPLGVEVGLGPGDFVFDGDAAPSSPRKRNTALTQFLAHVYCSQTAGCIKMPLGTEVNLGPGDVVLDGVAAPPKRGTAPSFRSMSIVAKRLDG